MLLKQLLIIFSFIAGNVFASNINQSSSMPISATNFQAINNSNGKLVRKEYSGVVAPTVVMPTSNPPATPESQTRKFSNLDSNDNDTDDLIQLNRKLQIEKAQAELRKIKNGVTNISIEQKQQAQTTVTGVAINQEGRKIAWLQFADGGSLTVNIGSKVGQYTVSDISMTGVTLSYVTNKKHSHPKSIFLKRAYSIADNGKKLSNSNTANNMFFTPSPVLTGANTVSSSSNGLEIVPPIVPTR